MASARLARALRPLVTAAAVGLLVPDTALAAGGDLDPAFGTGGRVATSFAAAASARAVVVDAAGRIVVAGAASNPNDTADFAIVRYTPAGALDETFGGGIDTASVSPGFDWAQALARQADGKLVAGGQADVAGQMEFAVVRFQDDGGLDHGFGTFGSVTTAFGGSFAAINAIAVQSGGGIVAAGVTEGGAGADLALARYDAGGALDPTFGVGGRVTLDAFGNGADDFLGALALQPDDAIVVAGLTQTGSSVRAFLARFDADGHLDFDFGLEGVADVPGVRALGGLAIQPDGAIVAAGTAAGDLAIVRVGPFGALDPTFGGGGVAVVPRPGSFEGAAAIVVQPDGKLVAGGTTNASGSSQFLLVRVDASGALDPSFGAGGVVTTSFGDSENLLSGLARQVDGRLVATGQVKTPSGAAFGTARYVADPSCGDRLVDAGEQCDDGNHAAGDCCAPDCTAEPDGSACSDGDLCTSGDACAGATCVPGIPVTCAPCEICTPAGGCAATPRTGCKRARDPRRAKLVITDRTRPSGDVVSWRLADVEATTPLELGDPVHGDDVTVCLFGADDTPLLRTRIPPGGTCGTAACWKAVAGTAVRYRDRSGAVGGVGAVNVRAGGAGRASAAIRAGGAHLTLPALPLALPVRLQLQSAGGACWESVHGPAGATRNDAGQFAGRGE